MLFNFNKHRNEVNMALKTFNLDKEIYAEFSKHCKEHGISMSKKVDNFIRQELSNIKSKKSDIGGISLEIDRDVENPQPQSPDQREHPMGKYC